MENTILILDFGSQFTQLIARRIREIGVYSIVASPRDALKAVAKHRPKGIIFSGGPASVTVRGAPTVDAKIYKAGLPILGICYGQQLMAHQLGGVLASGGKREFGRTAVSLTKACPLFGAKGPWKIGASADVWMSHGDHVAKVPPGFTICGTSSHAPCAIIADTTRHFYGLQFHPEVVHTPQGSALLEQFVRGVCACKPTWTPKGIVAEQTALIAQQVGNGTVICGLSGGVDSAVAAVLVHKAVGKALTCIFVDHGLLRHNEAHEVAVLFRQHFKIPLRVVNARKLFLDALKGVTDPERKRKIIGRLFIRVFEREARALKAKYLVQGTIYPDVIESASTGSTTSTVIKSHHNVGGLPKRLGLDLVEPLRQLFKDEVRRVGKELGLPDAFVQRHPFPGPGLALRVIGPVSETRLKVLRQADRIFLDALHDEKLYDKTWQAFAVLTPIRSVGVMGDRRTYQNVLALRAVSASDGMTADFSPLPMDFLGRVATRIVNEVHGVSRVVYDITSKPPATIEWE